MKYDNEEELKNQFRSVFSASPSQVKRINKIRLGMGHFNRGISGQIESMNELSSDDWFVDHVHLKDCAILNIDFEDVRFRFCLFENVKILNCKGTVSFDNCLVRGVAIHTMTKDICNLNIRFRENGIEGLYISRLVSDKISFYWNDVNDLHLNKVTVGNGIDILGTKIIKGDFFNVDSTFIVKDLNLIKDYDLYCEAKALDLYHEELYLVCIGAMKYENCSGSMKVKFRDRAHLLYTYKRNSEKFNLAPLIFNSKGTLIGLNDELLDLEFFETMKLGKDIREEDFSVFLNGILSNIRILRCNLRDSVFNNKNFTDNNIDYESAVTAPSVLDLNTTPVEFKFRFKNEKND